MIVTMGGGEQGSNEEEELPCHQEGVASSRRFKKARYSWQIKGKHWQHKRCHMIAEGSECSQSKKIQREDQLLTGCSNQECGEEVVGVPLSSQAQHSSDVAMGSSQSEEDQETCRSHEENRNGPPVLLAGNCAFPCEDSRSASFQNGVVPDLQVSSNPTQPEIVGVSNGHEERLFEPLDLSSTGGNTRQLEPNLRLWQSKQLEQGIIDNAINKVLGEMGLVPSHLDVFGYDGTGEGYINAQNIVNEGVSEAIRQQGLQRRRNQSAGFDSPRAWVQGGWERFAFESTSVSHPLSWVPDRSSRNNTSNTGVGRRQLFAIAKDDVATLSYNADIITQRRDCMDECDSDGTSSAYLGSDSPPQHEDLLNTAVSCAINQKGLGMLPLDY